MKYIEKQLPNITFYPISDVFTPDEILYFDIETTGLSADTSYLYLLGILTLKDGIPTLMQYFSENIAEEENLLISFFELLNQYKLCVTYNGTGFDIPYIIKKLYKYQLPYDTSKLIKYHNTYDSLHFDIYLEIKPLKKILGIHNLKQKTIEQLLGINRKDTFTGEELIDIYTQYIGKKRYEDLHKKSSTVLHKANKEVKKLIHDFTMPPVHSGLPILPAKDTSSILSELLLHNEEDLTGLTACCKILYSYNILKGNFDVIETKRSDLTNHIEIKIKPMKSPRMNFTNSAIKNNTIEFILPYYYIYHSEQINEETKLEEIPTTEDRNKKTKKLEKSEIFEYQQLSLFSDYEEINIQSPDITIFYQNNTIKNTKIETTKAIIKNESSSDYLIDNNNSSKVKVLLSFQDDYVTICIPLFMGELKYYFSDFKEYYYLPSEDMAIHKSVAEYVDKAYRQKANKKNCYQKKIGNFLPQPSSLFQPEFKYTEKDKTTFFEVTNQFLENEIEIKKYIMRLFKI